MSSLMCSRITSSSSRCCAAWMKLQPRKTKSTASTSALKSNLNGSFASKDFVRNDKTSVSFLCRSFASTEAEFVDYLKCWNCNADFSHCVHSMIACSTCNSIRNPPPLAKIDYFDLFDFARSFDIDVKLLANKFRSLQRLFHPDVFANRSQKEKLLSDYWSSIINEAYITLHRPNLRANYLLQLHGKPLEEGEMSMEPEFLGEVMELNEEISEAETRSEVESLMLKVKEAITEHESIIGKAFAENDVDKARKFVAELQYFVNLRDKLVVKETDLGIIN